MEGKEEEKEKSQHAPLLSSREVCEVKDVWYRKRARKIQVDQVRRQRRCKSLGEKQSGSYGATELSFVSLLEYFEIHRDCELVLCFRLNPQHPGKHKQQDLTGEQYAIYGKFYCVISLRRYVILFLCFWLTLKTRITDDRLFISSTVKMTGI